MAVSIQTYAEQVGRAYAEAARGQKVVLELWVSAVTGNVHVWMLVPDIDAGTELDLHRLSGQVYDHFGKADFQLHVVNPCYLRGDPSEIRQRVLPRSAVQIPLHAA